MRSPCAYGCQKAESDPGFSGPRHDRQELQLHLRVSNLRCEGGEAIPEGGVRPAQQPEEIRLWGGYATSPVSQANFHGHVSPVPAPGLNLRSAETEDQQFPLHRPFVGAVVFAQQKVTSKALMNAQIVPREIASADPGRPNPGVHRRVMNLRSSVAYHGRVSEHIAREEYPRRTSTLRGFEQSLVLRGDDGQDPVSRLRRQGNPGQSPAPKHCRVVSLQETSQGLQKVPRRPWLSDGQRRRDRRSIVKIRAANSLGVVVPHVPVTPPSQQIMDHPGGDPRRQEALCRAGEYTVLRQEIQWHGTPMRDAGTLRHTGIAL